MLLSRNKFFLYLCLILIAPFFAYRMVWIATSTRTTGTMYFKGHGDLGSALGMSTYPVIIFTMGRDTVLFKGNMDMELKPGDKIPVRYQRRNPEDARINTVAAMWADVFSYALFPLLVLLVLYVMPERFDPIIPRKSAIVLLGKKPFIKIIPAHPAPLPEN